MEENYKILLISDLKFKKLRNFTGYRKLASFLKKCWHPCYKFVKVGNSIKTGLITFAGFFPQRKGSSFFGLFYQDFCLHVLVEILMYFRLFWI